MSTSGEYASALAPLNTAVEMKGLEELLRKIRFVLFTEKGKKNVKCTNKKSGSQQSDQFCGYSLKERMMWETQRPRQMQMAGFIQNPFMPISPHHTCTCRSVTFFSDAF